MSDTSRLIRKEPERLTNGQMNLLWYSFDGRQAYEMWCWQTDGTRADTIRITTSINKNYFAYAAPEWMWGLSVLGCDTPILDWLKRRTAEKVRDLGVDLIDGNECRKVEFDNVPSNGLYRTRAWVWFDAGIDWLPRRIACSPLRYFELAQRQLQSSSGNMEPIRMTVEPGESFAAFDVWEYMQVDDPLLGRKRWFPKTGQATNGIPGTSTFEIDSVVVNQSIDAMRFVPIPAIGTQTTDQTTESLPRAKIHGGDEGLVARRELSNAQSIEPVSGSKPALTNQLAPQATSTPRPPHPDARPQRMAWWWPGITTVCLFLVALSLRKWMASHS